MKKSNESILAERGQVTIPKAIRDKLGMKAGSRLKFAIEGGRLVITKDIIDDPINKVRGCLPYLGSVDKLIDELRGGAN